MFTPNETLLKMQNDIIELNRKWNADGPLFQPVIDALEPIALRIELTLTGVDIAIVGNKEAFLTAMRALRSAGFSTGVEVPEKLYQFNAFFNHPKATLSVYFTFSSTVCRRVKIGTTLVEQPVYSIVCGENDARQDS